ncbi:MAG: TetR/AcrR family transcriptional regulator [Clostridia bacterium]|nr:TetR/AcrR family transcriptional regulator [Clostridia bacterium]
MRIATYQINEEEILDATFTYLVKNGLENITIRELCKGTGIAQGTLYYWFGDKANLICEVTEYGLKKIVDKIFRYVFKNMHDLRKFFDNCIDEIGRYKKELRFIYQMAASPVYGKKIRSRGKELGYIYDAYTSRLAEYLNCSQEKLQPIVYLFISAVLDYIIWEDKANTQLQLEFIYSVLTVEAEKNLLI